MNYFAYNLVIDSEIELPLCEAEPKGPVPPDVEISLGVPPEPPVEKPNSEYWIASANGGVLIHVPGVARFFVAEGKQIVIEPLDLKRDPTPYVLGKCFGSLLHQRGLLVLHASCVSSGDGAIAFLGHSGRGKSTLAAAFCRRGYSLLSDDVTALECDHDKSFRVLPGYPHVKLTPQSLQRVGSFSKERAAILESGKYRVGHELEFVDEATTLRALCVLVVPITGASGQVVITQGVNAVRLLQKHSYAKGLRALSLSAEYHFELCCSVSSGLPVLQVARSSDWGKLDALIEDIEAFL